MDTWARRFDLAPNQRTIARDLHDGSQARRLVPQHPGPAQSEALTRDPPPCDLDHTPLVTTVTDNSSTGA
jgi:hypothetical protein